MAPRVVIAGGGTAGHVYPGLALARALAERGTDVAFIGGDLGLEATLVPAAGFEFDVVAARPFRREMSLAALRAPVVALRAVRRCRELVRGAGAVVGMGGYVSVSSVLAARRERIPVVLHEQNAVPGLANRVLARMAEAIALSFPQAAHRIPRGVRTVLTGNPVREDILRVPEDRETLAKEARSELGLAEDRRTIVVFGGSQGALHIDRAAVGACRLLRDRNDLQVLVITGPAHMETVGRGWSQEPAGILVRLVPYLQRMELAYACADLVVSRAGATTVAELTVCGLPSLLIPYPYATGRHQEANARALQGSGGASVLLDGQLTARTLADRIVGLIDHQERLVSMADRSRGLGRPDAAARLADVVLEVSR